MLTITKSVTINGTSKNEDGELLATMYYSRDEKGMISTSTNVQSDSLYELNKTTIRADIDEFNEYCRNNEDEMLS